MVLAPGPTDIAGFLEDHEVMAAGLPERDAHADAGESTADDDDLVVADARLRPFFSLGHGKALWIKGGR
jgi:hypothetical protein